MSRHVGVPETSFYGPLQQFVNDVGRSTRPRVTAVMHPRGLGAGLPDGGLFAAEQLGRAGGNAAAFEVQPPTHGVVEAKPFSEDMGRLARTAQVRRYLDRYGKLLITNFRQFQLLVVAEDGSVQAGELVSLAPDEGAFDRLLSAPGGIDASAARGVVEQLERMLTHDAPIARPRDLAYHLASYARQALIRLEGGDLAALQPLKEAFDSALGITFEGEVEDRFFKSTLVQTLFYGAFSAWVLWSSGATAARGDRFDWRSASWFTNVPVIGALFTHVATADTLRPLRLDEVLDWAADALNRVNREVFFERFDADDAVTYFYEPFLAEFDPDLRRQLGVWYTPPEVVRYMVANVDRVLREEFGLQSGIADESVYVLDPCTGTGSFLIETLRLIHERNTQSSGDALVGDDVKRAAMSRVIGFEILPAPFVVAHMQLGLFLERLGAPLGADWSERAAVYLTNALTGWEDSPDLTDALFPELTREHDAAKDVKRHSPILVILGNPPYNAFAGVSPAEEGGLIDPYKEGLATWGFGTKHSINDLYVRFLRVAERKITEHQGRGIVSLITNFGYLSDPTLVVLRERLLAEFDRVWIDNLNGDSRETGKRTPDGHPDPSIFKTKGSPGIQTGTAIVTLARLPQHIGDLDLPTTFEEAVSRGPVLFGSVQYRDFWGADKKADLVQSLATGQPNYAEVPTVADTAFSFRPQQLHEDYGTWPRVADLAEAAPFPGLLEKRRGALVDVDRETLIDRMERYFDPSLPLEDLQHDLRGLREPAARFDPERTRSLLLNDGFRADAVRPFLFKPFDIRWAYVEPRTSIWNESRPGLVAAASQETKFFLMRRRTPRADDGAAFLMTSGLGDDHALHKNAYYMPLRLQSGATPSTAQGEDALFQIDTTPGPAGSSGSRANLSLRCRDWLNLLGLPDPDRDVGVSELPWLHALAIGYSPAYLAENRDAGRMTYHRLPMPGSRELLEESARLGRQIATLLDVREDMTPALANLGGDASEWWRTLGSVVARDPSASRPNLRIDNWAVLQGDKVMPSGSATVRDHEHLEVAAAPPGGGEDVLGRFVDIPLNDSVVWQRVPTAVWHFSIGGYPVLRKWLSESPRV